LLEEASRNKLLLKLEVKGQLRQFLIDTGASLSLVKPGVIQADFQPTNTDERGITGAKLKCLGNQIIEIILFNKTY
jgi:hypothetical protein